MTLSNKWKPIVEELLTWMSEDQIIETLTEKKIEEPRHLKRIDKLDS